MFLSECEPAPEAGVTSAIGVTDSSFVLSISINAVSNVVSERSRLICSSASA